METLACYARGVPQEFRTDPHVDNAFVPSEAPAQTDTVVCPDFSVEVGKGAFCYHGDSEVIRSSVMKVTLVPDCEYC